jgi:flagellar FliL protein
VASADASGEKGGGVLIGLVVVTLLALGFGAGFGMLLDTASTSVVETKPDSKQKPDKKAEKGPPPSALTTGKLVTMTPIVADLAEPQGTWIRIEASMVVEGMEMGTEVLAAQLAEDFVAYLRTASLSQFEGPSGFQNLREDLIDRATIRDREHIKDVIIHGVVVE